MLNRTFSRQEIDQLRGELGLDAEAALDALRPTILQLHTADYSNRAIAKRLGIHRDTVSRVIREGQ